MKISKKELLSLFNQFIQLQKLHFSEYEILQHAQHIHPSYKDICMTIKTQIQQGNAFTSALEQCMPTSTPISMNHATINSHTWLTANSELLKTLIDQETRTKKILIQSGGLLLLSLSATLIVMTYTLPQLSELLTEFSIPLPLWLTGILKLQTYSPLYLTPTLIIGLSLSALLINPLTKFTKKQLSPIKKNTERLCVLQNLYSYIKTNISIKKLSTNLTINNNAALHSELNTFKQQLLQNKDPKAAFNALLPNTTHQHILNQSIATKNLEAGLEQIITLISTKNNQILSRFQHILKSCMIAITTILLLAGFYITLLPLNALMTQMTQS